MISPNPSIWPTPGRNVWQVLVSLLVAVVGGLLLHAFWNHLGLPARPEAAWGWPRLLPSHLHMFTAMVLPLLVWLPTAMLSLLIHLSGAMQEARSRELCLRALTMDATTYLLLAGMLLLLVLWRDMGNGFAALGLAYFGLYTFKAILLVWTAWHILVEKELGWRGGAAVFCSALLLFSLPLVWAWQAAPVLPQELANLGDAVSLLPGIQAGGESAVPQARLLYRMVLAPFAFLGGRLGGLILNALCATGTLTLLWRWLRGQNARWAAPSVALIMISAPLWAGLDRVGPDPLGMLLVAAAVWGLKRPAFAPICAMHLTILDPVYLPVSLALMVWGFYEALRPGWGKLTWRARVLLIGAIAGMAGSLFTHSAEAAQGAVHFLGPRRLLLVAPIWLLVLAGLPDGLRDPKGSGRWLLLPPLAVLAGLALASWLDLPLAPDRAMYIIMPLAAWYLNRSLTALSGPWWRLAVALPAGLSLGFTWLAALLPHLRPGPDGASAPLLQGMGNALGVDLLAILPLGARLTPSLIWGLFWLLGAAWLGWRVWKKPAGPLNPMHLPFSALEGYGLALGLGIAVLAAVLAAALV